MGVVMEMTFDWHGHTFPLFDHPYNLTLQNERAVEIPVAQQFVRQPGVGLEVGNVLSHYQHVAHRVVDLHETAPNVDNIDLFDIDGHYDWCVAISTVEHVRWDFTPRDPDGAAAAIAHLRSIADRLLVTVPLGYHRPLDNQIRSGELEPARDCVMVRDRDRWVQQTRRTWRPYGMSTLWAEAVWIGEW